MPVSLALELCAMTIQKYSTAAVADLLIRYTLGNWAIKHRLNTQWAKRHVYVRDKR
jgi:hypothetical protein